MKDRFFLVFICAILNFAIAQSQEVIKVDSFRTKTNLGDYNQPLKQTQTSALEPIITSYKYDVKPEFTKINPKAIELEPIKAISPSLIKWRGGELLGYGSYRESPGMGFGRTSSFIFNQQLGKFSLSSNLSLNKDYMSGWGYMNSANLGLMLSYPLNNNLSLTAFGGINQAGFLTSGAGNMLGYYYGGYLTMNTNNGKFGMDMGMRRYFDPISGQWIYVPIVAPYVNLGGQKLSVDMGGLLLQSVKGLDQWLNPKRSNGGSNPRGGGIIMPETHMPINIPPPNIPYIK